MANLAFFQETLGVLFKDISVLRQALVHSSYLNENPAFASLSNERLEFLGDAVLGLVITEKLYQDFPHLAEGEMTKLRAALVRSDTLADLARGIELGSYLYMGKGEEKGGGRLKSANLAGAMEAVIAAIFLDQELAVTRDFILRLFELELQKVLNQGTAIDYKSALQELVQAKEQCSPTYHLITASGPDHDKQFTVEVRLGETVLGRGSGKSKKAAEAAAARAALEHTTTTFTP